MEWTSLLGLVAVAALVLANGFFVATEFAIVAVRRSRLEQLAADGVATARTALELIGHLDAYIAACQFGITIASLGLGWIGEPALASLIEPPLHSLLGEASSTAAHGVAIAVSFSLITALHIVLGELSPKGLALQRAEGTVLFVAGPMRLFYWIFRWPITALNAIGNGALRLVGLQPATGHEMVHSVEELRYLVTGMQRAGVVEASEARIASRAFEFADLTAGALMTPRGRIEGLPIGASREEVLQRVLATSHTRLLAYDRDIDQIVGVVRVRDLLPLLFDSSRPFDLRPLIRSILVVPESKRADDLLEEMRSTRHQIALVVDEYGGTAGIVTLEDLLEGLVGRIEEEPPLGAVGGVPLAAEQQADGSLLLDGLTRLGEFEELTGARLEEFEEEGVETLGGLMMAALGKVPTVGDEVIVAGYKLRVEQLDRRRVALVRVIPETGQESRKENEDSEA